MGPTLMRGRFPPPGVARLLRRPGQKRAKESRSPRIPLQGRCRHLRLQHSQHLPPESRSTLDNPRSIQQALPADSRPAYPLHLQPVCLPAQTHQTLLWGPRVLPVSQAVRPSIRDNRGAWLTSARPCRRVAWQMRPQTAVNRPPQRRAPGRGRALDPRRRLRLHPPIILASKPYRKGPHRQPFLMPNRHQRNRERPDDPCKDDSLCPKCESTHLSTRSTTTSGSITCQDSLSPVRERMKDARPYPPTPATCT